jgi:hypothetical protein
MKRFLLILSGILIIIVLAIGLAFVLPARSNIYDFVMLYSTNLGVIYHVPIYDTAAIETLTIAHTHAAPGEFHLFPYPYPPWYALCTFYLGFLSPEVAANAWMLLNIAMLVMAILLLTDGWKPIYRILTTLAALLFLPTLGLIVVGQYSAPVLLGAALFSYSARRQDAPLTALGLLLMTFKPHIGLFLFPAGLLWLVFQKTPFARRALWLTLVGGLILVVLGFIADPVWPLNYVRALTGFTTIPGVASRDLSASFSVLLIKMVTGYGNASWAAWLSLVIVIMFCLLFWRFKIFANVEVLVAGCVLLTLLGGPYLFNYDYVLLLLPLIYLAGQANSFTPRLILVVAYLLPWISLILARGANIFYAFSAITLVVILLGKTPKSAY